MEQNVGICAVNVPPLRPLFAKVFRMGSSNNSGDKGSNGDGSELKNISDRRQTRSSSRPRTIMGERGKVALTQFDDQSSQRSLMSEPPEMPPLAGHIVKTVSVRVRSDEHNDHAYPDIEPGVEERSNRSSRGCSWTNVE